ncbi:hypothetical protein TanjilG_28580 [Lupinus angustifolius]|uniref:Uncharacterized protein n=1 Tax=Lupinus angustifolius TaxID=3871 RepID=A0A4P1RJ61_LUPAN|nr:hypothetical protein TanjilG_28580 [Lupinus angustifolius]
MDVENLMDHMKEILTSHTDNMMGKFKEHDDILNVRMDIMGLMIDLGFEDIYRRISRLEGNFPPIG